MNELTTVNGKELQVVDGALGKCINPLGEITYETEVMRTLVKDTATHGLRSCGALDVYFAHVADRVNIVRKEEGKSAITVNDLFNGAVLTKHLIPIVRYYKHNTKKLKKTGVTGNKWEGLGYRAGSESPEKHILNVTDVITKCKVSDIDDSLQTLHTHTIAFKGDPATLEWLDTKAMPVIIPAAIEYSEQRHRDNALKAKRKRDDARDAKRNNRRMEEMFNA